jgi:hypothetical protein
MDAAMNPRRKDAPTVLSALGRFGGFKPESENVVRTIEVKQNPIIERMKRVWKKCSFSYNGFLSPEDELKGNEHLTAFLLSTDYSAKDIADFSLALIGFQGEKDFQYKAGFFLSALMCGSHETDFHIPVSHFERPINALGRHNMKNIIINGDVGSHVGMMMGWGTIIVNGNACDQAGCRMEDGSLIIEGGAGRETGASMGGGTLLVKGNVLDYAGDMMDGGRMTVKGNAGEGFGSRMGGGVMILEGNAGDKVGFIMTGGTIIVHGTSGKDVGELMDKGEIHIYGSKPVISKDFISGKIFHGEKLVLKKRISRKSAP